MRKIDEFLLKFEKNAAKILILVMVILVFASGIMRFLRYPINWAVDMSTFMFAWACFFAADVAWREGKMMTVDLFVKRLSRKVQKILRLVNYFIITAFLIYLVIWGFYLSYTTRFRTFVGIPNFSYTWVTLSIPIGAILMLRTTFLKIKSEFAENKERASTEGEDK